MATRSYWRKKAGQYARAEGINPTLFQRQIGAESNYDEKAGSPAGAGGIAQFMPGTASSRGVDRWNPRSALKGAAKLMAEYLESYNGDWSLALAAYNAGPGNARRAVTGFPETRNYIKKVLGGGSGKQAAPKQAADAGPWSVKRGEKPTFDTAGFEQARKRALVGSMIAKRRGTGSILFRTGLLTTTAPSAADFQGSAITSKLIKPKEPRVSSAGLPSGAGGMLERAKAVDAKKPSYLWGGGHGAKPAPLGSRVDCSGFVSQVLGVSPRVSGQFARFGRPGPGKLVTIYANSGHVLMSIRDGKGRVRWFGTSRSNPGGGAGEISRPSAGYLRGFTARHPAGM